MRIIAGSCKGRSLKTVKGRHTRPTTDKVKESIFNMLGQFFEGGTGLDLFAGSGGLGLEALSRGFSQMIFVDKSPHAIEAINANVAECGFTGQVEIYRNDAIRALQAVKKRGLQFSVVFLDPPYQKLSLASIIETIDQAQLLQSGGHLVVEHASEDKLPEEIGRLKRTRFEVYSHTIALSIYTYPNE